MATPMDIWKIARAHAKRHGLSDEDAEDFASLYITRSIETNYKASLRFVWIDYLRATKGDKRWPRPAIEFTDEIEDLEAFPKMDIRQMLCFLQDEVKSRQVIMIYYPGRVARFFGLTRGQLSELKKEVMK